MARFAVDVVFTYKATFLVEADSHDKAKALVYQDTLIHPSIIKGRQIVPANSKLGTEWTNITISNSVVLDKAVALTSKPATKFVDYGDDGEE